MKAYSFCLPTNLVHELFKELHTMIESKAVETLITFKT